MDNFLFIFLPYLAIVMFFGGTAYRAFSGRRAWSARGDFFWTTRSTGFFGRATIGPAALCLHWGLITLVIAHIVGFIGGAYFLTNWVAFFRWVGLFGGILFLYGVLWAFFRRITNRKLRAMSRMEDYNILILLLIVVGLGLYQSAIKLVFGISYLVGPWLGSLFRLQPDIQSIAVAPLLNKLHVIFALTFFVYFPFTKLVHLASYPFQYFFRNYISVRTYRGLKK